MTKKVYNMSGMTEQSYGKSIRWPQYAAALSVCLGAVAAGSILGWTGNNTEELKDGKLNDIKLSEDDVGNIGSFTALGALIMCFPIGYLCDIIGRKLTMLLTIIPFSLGWLLIIFSTNKEMIFAGRFITGAAGGAFCVTAPLYTSEIAETAIRGTLGSYFQLLLTVGILFSYILGAYVPPKGFTIACAIIPFVFCLVFFFQPETPIYLMKKKKEGEALKSLRKLRGSDYNCELELKEIKEKLEWEENNKISFMQAIKSVAAKKAMVICFGLMIFQQFSGVNAVIFYTNDIFNSAGSSIAPEISVIIVGVTQVLATFVSSLIVDRFGRKILLIISDFFMMLSSLLLGIFFTLQTTKGNDYVSNIAFLPILSLIVFITVFSLGFGPIPWMASAEIFPPEIRTVGGSAAGTFNWLLCFIVTKFYLSLKTAIGGDKTFYIFTCISLIGTLFVWFVVPETKGKTSDEVRAILEGNAPRRSQPEQVKEGIDNPTFK